MSFDHDDVYERPFAVTLLHHSQRPYSQRASCDAAHGHTSIVSFSFRGRTAHHTHLRDPEACAGGDPWRKKSYTVQQASNTQTTPRPIHEQPNGYWLAVVPGCGAQGDGRNGNGREGGGLSGDGDGGDGVTTVIGQVDTATGRAAAVRAAVTVRNCA